MVEMKIIQAVIEPTDWANNLILVGKPNGSLKNLTKILDNPTMPIQLQRINYLKWVVASILQNLMPVMSIGKKIEESSNLLTFNSPFGCYQFLRMPYRIHSDSDVCQQKIAQIIDGIDGTANSQDDIIIWGSTQQVLESRLMKVFISVKKSGLKLNRSKSQFNKGEAIFWGQKMTATGIYPDDRKVEAIKNIKTFLRYDKLFRKICS